MREAAIDEGSLSQHVVEELARPYGGMNIPGPQLHPQAEATSPFAGKNRSVGGLPVASLGNIAPRHAFLGPIGHERRRIGIDHRAVEHTQPSEEFGAKFVVGCFETPQGVRTETQQEGPQGVAMRKVVHPQQRRDESVVDQALSVLDATQARHDGKDVSQKQVGGMIVPVIVVGPPNEGLQKAANCKCPAKGLKQTEPSKAGEAAFFEGEIEFPGAFGHILTKLPKR